jgi:hypothetical protein
MKKVFIGAIAGLIVATALNAGEFEKKSEMMESRINSKMEKYKGNSAALDFLTKKMTCVKDAKTVDDLKNCKEKYHPKDLKKIVE